jgi:hypothetical protein
MEAMIKTLINKFIKPSKKTIVCLILIIYKFLNPLTTFNYIMKILLCAITFLIGKMLLKSPHEINLEDYQLRNGIGLIAIIAIMNKTTSFLSTPTSIIMAINALIKSTGIIANGFMDGTNIANICIPDPVPIPVPVVPIDLPAVPVDLLAVPNPNQTSSIEKEIIKSILEKIISKL